MMKKLIFPLLFALGISTHVDAQKPYKAYMVSNTHLDTQWLWTVQTTIDHYLYRTLTQNFWLIDHYPGYIFNFEGAVRCKRHPFRRGRKPHDDNNRPQYGGQEYLYAPDGAHNSYGAHRQFRPRKVGRNSDN
mgnify:CR=1 FL=1